MEKMKVHELMRPVEEFPRISSRATFVEAVEALAAAEKEYRDGRAKQRILLVCDDDGRIIGKLSPMDVLQGLEPKYEGIQSLENFPHYRLAPSPVESLKEELKVWERPLSELCRKAVAVKIEHFVKLPTPDHMVNADDYMDKAFHLFVVGRHDSLFVTAGEAVVGVILFSDVYREIVHTLRECSLAL